MFHVQKWSSAMWSDNNVVVAVTADAAVGGAATCWRALAAAATLDCMHIVTIAQCARYYCLALFHRR